MGVQESGTPMYARQIMRHLDGDVKMSAFRAKNPSLASQLEMVKDNPRQIKKLSAESACELVEMITDTKLLDSIYEIETRVSVRESLDAVSRELNGRALNGGREKKVTTVSEKTARYLKRSPAQAAEKISNATSLDVPMVLEWCKNLSPDDLAVFASKLGYCYAFMSEKDDWITFQQMLVERLSDGDPDVLRAASSRLQVEILREALLKAPQELNMFLTLAVAENCTAAPVLVKDGVLVTKRPCPAASDVLLMSDDVMMKFWFGLISAKQASKEVRADNEYDGWRVIAAATNAHDADLLLTKAEKLGWLAPDEDVYRHYHSAASRVAGALYEIDGLDKAWQVKLSRVISDEDMRLFLFRHRICKPTIDVIDEIASSVSPEKVCDTLTTNTYSRQDEPSYDQDIVEQVVQRFVQLTPGLPHNISSGRHYSYYWGTRGSLLSPVLAKVLSERFSQTESLWSVFWGLVETAHDDATFEELIMAAEALGI